jgi:hypothetical protein
MITRVFVTSVMLLLGIYAFWGDALGAGRILNPFGIMFMLLGALIWFKWEIISESFKSVKNESNIPIIRLGASIIEGMGKRVERWRRSPSA